MDQLITILLALVNPTVDTQLKQSNLYWKGILQAVQQMNHMAYKAKTQKDTIKLVCIDDKLLQAKGEMKHAKMLRRQFELAVKQDEPMIRELSLKGLKVKHTTIIQLSRLAESCVGEEIGSKTSVQFEVDPELQDSKDPKVEAPMAPVVRPPNISAWR